MEKNLEEVTKYLTENKIIYPSALCRAHQKVSEGRPCFILGDATLEKEDFDSLVNRAIKEGKSETEGKYQKEIDRQGPPDSYNYQWWENNVRYEFGTAKISLDLTGEMPVVDIKYKSEGDYWTGY